VSQTSRKNSGNPYLSDRTDRCLVFTFTRKERRALLLLAWTIILLTGLRSWWSQTNVPLQLFPASIDEGSSSQTGRMAASPAEAPRQLDDGARPAGMSDPEASEFQSEGESARARQPFDPNEAGVEEMKAAGLPGKVAYTIKRYREKGGRFYQKTDLLKIYDMTDSLFARVEHLILLTEQKPLPETPNARITININAADEEQWTYLPGIGKGYARRICKFRDALGGFASVQQVGETFGLPDSTFRRILPQLQPGEFRPGVRINEWDAAQLAAHPYIHPKEARILVNFRNQHGAYQADRDVRRALMMMDSLRLNRLLPYLDYTAEGPTQN